MINFKSATHSKESSTAILFFAGMLIGALFQLNLDLFLSKAYRWQSLLGSMIGAAAPIGLFLINESYQNRKRRHKYVELLYQSVASAINNLSTIDVMLHAFVDVKMKYQFQVLEEAAKDNAYSIGQPIIPLTNVFTFDKSLLNENTGSSYIDNMRLQIISDSHDVPLFLRDLERQLQISSSLNTQIALMGLNSKADNNALLKTSYSNFQAALERDMFKQNIPLYLRKLAATIVPLEFMYTNGFNHWKRTFNGSQSASVEEKMLVVENFFKADIDAFIKARQVDFKSKLLLCGEQVVL